MSGDRVRIRADGTDSNVTNDSGDSNEVDASDGSTLEWLCRRVAESDFMSGAPTNARRP
ncbi:hypothetical protein [Natronosalvus caseinilyticus]|uniref:hypothetical protein n=1 Tax=Natronosalvus caseinilyticus TaxID=2953747 RepID=UPI0028B1EB9D|nr:hypothetical protein [Natronosalvus caseinilyticus]